MKNRGTHSTVERVSNAIEKRGMTRSDRPQRFIMTPPHSIPMAAEGRFTAPGQATHTFSSSWQNLDFCVLCNYMYRDHVSVSISFLCLKL